jgi:hypothetical protein
MARRGTCTPAERAHAAAVAIGLAQRAHAAAIAALDDAPGVYAVAVWHARRVAFYCDDGRTGSEPRAFASILDAGEWFAGFARAFGVERWEIIAGDDAPLAPPEPAGPVITLARARNGGQLYAAFGEFRSPADALDAYLDERSAPARLPRSVGGTLAPTFARWYPMPPSVARRLVAVADAGLVPRTPGECSPALTTRGDAHARRMLAGRMGAA